MTNRTMQNTDVPKAIKLDWYIRAAEAKPDDFEEDTIASMLVACSHFFMETGAAITPAEGDSTKTTQGVKLVLANVLTGTMSTLKATSADYNALMTGTEAINGVSVDIFAIEMPASRTVSDAEVGDQLHQVYGATVFLRRSLTDSAPNKIEISFEKTDEVTEIQMPWDVIIANT